MAFDVSKVGIDLAFPSKKKGKLEEDEVVNFSKDATDDKETFWTVWILQMDIDKAKAIKNLPIVFCRFVASALEKSDSWTDQGRVQQKITMRLSKWKTRF